MADKYFIKTFDELEKLISDLDKKKGQLLFRGQSNSNLNPDSTINEFKHWKLEAEIYKNSTESKENNLKKFINFDLNKLSNKQHYGEKTPLIDFTSNILVALFFSINNKNYFSDIDYRYEKNGKFTDKNYFSLYVLEYKDENIKNKFESEDLIKTEYIYKPPLSQTRSIAQRSYFIVDNNTDWEKRYNTKEYKINYILANYIIEYLNKNNINFETVYPNDNGIYLQNVNKYKSMSFISDDILDRFDRPIEALNCFNNELKSKPKTKEFWNNKGNILYELKQYKEAIKCYDKALKIDLKLKEAWNGKGIVLNKLSKYKEAVECYDKALEIDINFEEFWNNKGISLNELNNYEEAIKCFDKSIEINPNFKESWNNKGISLNRLGKYELADKCYDTVLEKIKNYSMIWNNKGINLTKLIKNKEAKECYDKALKIDPNYRDALYNQNNNFLINYKDNGVDIQEGNEFVSEIKSINKNNNSGFKK